MVARPGEDFRGRAREGVRRGKLRPDLDPRLATLAMLGMLNAATTWYRSEEASIERISEEFTQLVLDGALPRGADSR